jgi:hypothetical protein
MKVTHTTHAPCCMSKGEVRRVPQDPRAGLLGYHVGCPSCGYVTLLLHGRLGLGLLESPSGSVSTSKPFACLFCQRQWQLTVDELQEIITSSTPPEVTP